MDLLRAREAKCSARGSLRRSLQWAQRPAGSFAVVAATARELTGHGCDGADSAAASAAASASASASEAGAVYIAAHGSDASGSSAATAAVSYH